MANFRLHFFHGSLGEGTPTTKKVAEPGQQDVTLSQHSNKYAFNSTTVGLQSEIYSLWYIECQCVNRCIDFNVVLLRRTTKTVKLQIFNQYTAFSQVTNILGTLFKYNFMLLNYHNYRMFYMHYVCVHM